MSVKLLRVEFLVCHAVRWQGTGSDEVSTRDQKSKNPDNLLQSWRNEKINGPS
uniref:Uncharacterized protein n=1 Tax=Klebsiella pneumoniae TaxID=573 RepID=A0A2P1BPS0_KLEPN|nr:hypothetical protein [Klebsiella pneumoniae]